MFPNHYDEDWSLETGGIHGLLEEVNLASQYINPQLP